MREVYRDDKLTPTQKFGLNLFQLVDKLGELSVLKITYEHYNL